MSFQEIFLERLVTVVRQRFLLRLSGRDMDAKGRTQRSKPVRHAMNCIGMKLRRAGSRNELLRPGFGFICRHGNHEQIFVTFHETGLTGLVEAQVDMPQIGGVRRRRRRIQRDTGAIDMIQDHPGIDMRGFARCKPGLEQLPADRFDVCSYSKYDIVYFNASALRIATEHDGKKFVFCHFIIVQ